MHFNGAEYFSFYFLRQVLREKGNWKLPLGRISGDVWGLVWSCKSWPVWGQERPHETEKSQEWMEAKCEVLIPFPSAVPHPLSWEEKPGREGELEIGDIIASSNQSWAEASLLLLLRCLEPHHRASLSDGNFLDWFCPGHQRAPALRAVENQKIVSKAETQQSLRWQQRIKKEKRSPLTGERQDGDG